MSSLWPQFPQDLIHGKHLGQSQEYSKHSKLDIIIIGIVFYNYWIMEWVFDLQWFDHYLNMHSIMRQIYYFYDIITLFKKLQNEFQTYI